MRKPGIDVLRRNGKWELIKCSARLQVEKALERSIYQNKLILDSVGEGIYGVDLLGNTTFVNPTAVKITGYDVEELIGRHQHEILHHLKADGSPYPQEECPIYAAMIDGIPHHAVDEVFWKKDGTSFPVEYVCTPMKEKGEIIGAVVVFKDVTERKRIEEELKQSQNQMAEAQKLAHVGSWDWDLSTGKLHISEELGRILGFDIESSHEQNLSIEDGVINFTHPDDQSYLRGLFEEARRSKKPFEHQHRAIRPDGSIRILRGRAEVYTDARGNPDKIIGFVQDITEMKKVEEEKEKIQSQLLQSQKMEAIGLLAGGVAHDFNNLLTTIQGYASFAMTKVDSANPLYRDLNRIHLASVKAANLTRQLLLFSRKQTIEPASLDLNGTVENLLKMLHRLIGEDVSINLDLDPHIWPIRADEGNIEQVIMNLVVNARDAMPEGGTLTIKTENITLSEDYPKMYLKARAGKFVCLSIADTGIGMDKETMNRIFEPFFTTKGLGKGTGLGLSVAYGIIEEHKGWINIYSEPKMGSVFRIYLPASLGRPQSKVKTAISLEGLQGKGERILVVEDEEEVRKFTAKVLQEYGYSVTEAANVREALDVFDQEKGQFDLVLSDIILPDQTGIELIDQLLLRRPKLNVLLMSGYTGQKSQWPQIQKRGLKFLQKPFDLPTLLQTIRKILKPEPA